MRLMIENLLWFVVAFGVLVLLSGCVTARHWQPDTHKDMMLMCRTMCKHTGVRAYEPMTGDCTCNRMER